jgi:hypothetical protein
MADHTCREPATRPAGKSAEPAERQLGPGFFRGVYLAAGAALAALTALCGFAWGGRAAAGMAAGGAISIGVLLSWQWLAGWIMASPGSGIKRRLIFAWPLKYGVIGAALWALLRYDVVNVFALIAGLGLIQAVIFWRALVAARPLLTAAPSASETQEGHD